MAAICVSQLIFWILTSHYIYKDLSWIIFKSISSTITALKIVMPRSIKFMEQSLCVHHPISRCMCLKWTNLHCNAALAVPIAYLSSVINKCFKFPYMFSNFLCCLTATLYYASILMSPIIKHYIVSCTRAL